MVRYVVLLILGAVIGGGLVLATSGRDAQTQNDVTTAAIRGVDTRSIANDADSQTESVDSLAGNGFVAESNEIRVLAESDLAQAVARAMEQSGDSLKRMLLISAGEGSARRDPVAALAHAASITDLELRSGLTLGILNAWAELDPAGMLEYLKTAARDEIRAPVPFERLVIGDPLGILNSLDDFNDEFRPSVERAALLALAETDAVGTLARLDGMPPGPGKMQLMLAVAETYGRQDPNAALTWAASLSPPSPAALTGVVNGVANVDFNQALDWVLREVESPSFPGIDAAAALQPTNIFQAMRAGALQMPLTADRLLATGDPTLKSNATAALMIWAQERPNEAVDFAISRLNQLEPGDLTTLAMQTASTAPGVATQTANRLPPDYRASWVAGVADALVRAQPQRALDYLAGQRGQPGYDEGVVAVVRQLAAADPETAAGLVTDSPASPQIANAAGIVASAWASDSISAAEQWALGLTSPEARDAGIMGVLNTKAAAGDFDEALIDAMSSAATRQQAASRAIIQIGRTDQAQARELIQAHISDQVQRTQLEQQLAQMARFGATGANMPRLPTINFEQ